MSRLTNYKIICATSIPHPSLYSERLAFSSCSRPAISPLPLILSPYLKFWILFQLSSPLSPIKATPELACSSNGNCLKSSSSNLIASPLNSNLNISSFNIHSKFLRDTYTHVFKYIGPLSDAICYLPIPISNIGFSTINKGSQLPNVINGL